jgi:transcriptional regulator with XRE-family HTH domain
MSSPFSSSAKPPVTSARDRGHSKTITDIDKPSFFADHISINPMDLIGNNSLMPQVATTRKVPVRESADSLLAKNLVTARVAAGITQQELADAAQISRATIAQIETGYSDPRLSTIVELAKALGLPAICLLVGLLEVRALAQVLERTVGEQPVIDPRDVKRMGHHIETGMLKDRLRAAMIGAQAAESHSEAELARITAAIFSAFLPGPGTAVGALLGELLAESNSSAAHSVRQNSENGSAKS